MKTIALCSALLFTTTAYSDTITLQPAQSGKLTHSFYCCGFNTYYDSPDEQFWTGACNTNPFGCVSSDLAGVWRWNLSELQGAEIHSAEIKFYTNYCSDGAGFSFGPISGEMNSSQALALQNNNQHAGMASLAWPLAVDATVLQQSHKMGSLGAYVYSDTSCMVFGNGDIAPELTIDFTPGQSGECSADVTGDETVNVSDVLALIAYWGTNNAAHDIDESGSVDVGDVLLVIDGWGGC